MSVFLAVWPDQATIELLSTLDRPERRGVRWTDPGHWHVTLAFLGDTDPRAAAAALDGLGQDSGRQDRSAQAAVGPVTRLLNRTVLVAPVAGLNELAVAAHSACRQAGLDLEDRPFRGHLTLARGRRPADLAGLAGEAVATRFAVTSVDLVASTPEPGGGPNRYDVLGRRALATPRV